jgi:hypothetical protein
MPDTSNVTPLHPRIEELLEYLEETRAAFLMAVSAVPGPWRDAKPEAGRWSLGEIVNHVAKVESSCVRLLTKKVVEARSRGHESETDSSSLLATFDTSRLRDRTRRIEAPPVVVPDEGASVDDALAALARSRAALRAALTDASGLALGTITFPHPALGLLNMYQWVLSIGGHDARHAEQVRELAQPTAAR